VRRKMAGVDRESPSSHLVRACAWDHGGVDFIFSDNTIFSFTRGMHTFVVAGPSSGAEAGQERGTSSTTTNAAAVLPGREMCFTSWTVGAHYAQVAECLRVYNCLSPRPALFSQFLRYPRHTNTFLLADDTHDTPKCMPHQPSGLPSCPACPRVQTWWQEEKEEDAEGAVPLEVLHLTKDPALLESYEVWGTCQPTIDRETDTWVGTSGGAHCGRRVCLGRVLVLWCAHRRVRLTVAAHRRTFCVRWPAPVPCAAAAKLPSTAPASPHRQLFVWCEQVFPVCAPPAAWAAMLSLAFELEEVKRHAVRLDTFLEGRVFSFKLPAANYGVGGNEGNALGPTEPSLCTFSPLSQLQQGSFLIAPTATRAIASLQQELYPPGTQLRWMWERPVSSSPSALFSETDCIYWCLSDDTAGDWGGAAALGREVESGSVVGLVGQDASYVAVCPGSCGYQVWHHRYG